ncbi:hypothetical protein FIBSPDRAFT_526236 [Athelia psychrophila]|uniref:Uncharacterized protein n=1 Tax=Athelia psychrophila TaxID=1759441 RepID=A0A166JJZ9_9AGAM|nr:hypothetical protein FIBSPDRAFT_526236 [Fibularhizoctonia sp. CBS 109695]
MAPIAVNLSLSQQMPIDILVLCISMAADLSPFCALIQPHLARCRKVEIIGNDSVGDKLLRMLQPISAPFLQSVQLDAQRSGWGVASTPSFAGGAPMLRHVSLNGHVHLGATLPHRSTTHLQLELHSFEWGWPACSSWITAQLLACPLLVHPDLGNLSVRPWLFSSQFHLPLLLTLSFFHHIIIFRVGDWSIKHRRWSQIV